mgnify:FL=1
MTDNSPAALMTESRAEVVTQPKRVLSHVVGKSLSGCLTFCDPRSPSTSWQLYVRSGQLAYATSASRRDERLRYLLRSSHRALAKHNFSEDSFEYSDICGWWHSHSLPMAKLRQLLMKLTLEALVQILALPSTRVSLDRTARVDPVLIETSLSNLPAPLLQMASQWQQWGKLLCSPFDALILNEVQKSAFFALWKERPLPVKGQRHTQLQPEDAAVQLIEGSSVYKIATNLNVSVNNVVAWSLPYVKEGILSFVGDRQDVMTAEAEPSNLTFEEAARASEGRELRATIACIDDSKTVQKQVRGILGMSGYDVLGITEPAQALTALVRQRPAVILMDVNMPDVDGYELCSMLRQSRQLREIPIVMLTGRDGILDRLRAKTLGVEFYLTKPFDPERLLESIQKAIDSTDKAI